MNKRKLPPTELEKKVIDFLVSHNIPFKLHATLECNGKPFNVDFVIPSCENPKIVIEVFSSKSNSRNLRAKAIITDHRFLVLKMKDSQLKTVMIEETRPFVTQETKEHIRKEIMSADLVIIDNEEELHQLMQQELLKFIKENLE
jgi:hypothetical protein